MRLYEDLVKKQEKLAVVGLGYVGLPIAIAFSHKINVVGFDVNAQKIEKYHKGMDVTETIGDKAVQDCNVYFTSDPEELKDVKFFIIAVPTPVQSSNVPDLTPVEEASRMVGKYLTKGAVVVYESTVYPGVTEDVCIPILEAASGLQCGIDFKIGYSPERINPCDEEHLLHNITKVVSGMDEESLDTIAKVYELVIEAGVHRAESIKVAEAAKVIENSQRDINIAFMNEVSMLLNELGIDTKAVLEAAATKWNFLSFAPGLVGGHCIGVDPYYLTYKAEEIGFPSRVILTGRHVNDGMGKYVAQQVIKQLVRLKKPAGQFKVGIMGVTYKENCSDLRNSKVIDIIHELEDYGISPVVVDPLVDRQQLQKEYGVELSDMSAMTELDAVIVAVAHTPFKSMKAEDYIKLFKDGEAMLLADVKGIYDKQDFESLQFHYWRL